MIRKYLITALIIAIIVPVSIVALIRFGVLSGTLVTTKSEPPLSAGQIKEAMQKAGGEETLAKEATDEIRRFGSDNGATAYQLKNCPAITKMASLVGGEIVGMQPSGGGIPAHVRIRRGSHFDYQFIYIFGVGARPSAGPDELIPIAGPAYLRNTSTPRR